MAADNHSRGGYNSEFWVCKICFVFLEARLFLCIVRSRYRYRNDWGCSSVVEHFLKGDAQSWGSGGNKQLLSSLIPITSTHLQFWGVHISCVHSSSQVCPSSLHCQWAAAVRALSLFRRCSCLKQRDPTESTHPCHCWGDGSGPVTVAEAGRGSLPMLLATLSSFRLCNHSESINA